MELDFESGLQSLFDLVSIVLRTIDNTFMKYCCLYKTVRQPTRSKLNLRTTYFQNTARDVNNNYKFKLIQSDKCELCGDLESLSHL